MLFGIIILVGISLLIIVHELGHFIAAKQAGLRVDEFGFGFPPRMFSWRPKHWIKGEDGTLRQAQGDTVYSVNWIPFGGFVKIYGERGDGVINEVGGVNEISGVSGEKEASTLHISPTDASRSFSHQKAWTRLTIIAAGVAMNFIAGWFLLSLVFMVGAPQTVVITGVKPESPAQVAGLLEGDQVLEYKTAAEFIAATESRRGQEFSFHVKRGGEELSITAIPREKKVAGEGAIGVMISEAGFSKLPFFTALWEGLKTSIEAMSQILQSFGRLFADVFGHAKITEGVVGPIGIFGVAHQLGSLGLVYLLQLIGMISLNLAILNAIPFPALDGGRFLFILIEKIKGSKISARKELVMNLIGFGLLFVLMIAITARDIIRLF